MAQSHYSLGRNTPQLSPLPLQSETHRRSQSPSLLDVLVNHTQSRTFCNRKKKVEHITLLQFLFLLSLAFATRPQYCPRSPLRHAESRTPSHTAGQDSSDVRK